MAGLQLPDDRASARTLAEHLGGWLGWTDAIALASVLPGSGQAVEAQPRGVASPSCAALRAACADLHAELARAVSSASAAAATDCNGSERGAEALAPWRRRTATLQRKLDARIAALRGRVRAALCAGSARLQQLAALDAVLEDALRGRERHLLGTVPGLLESHCRRSGDDSRAAAAAWERVMHAELELRLQPVLGLLDALEEEGMAKT